MCFPKKPLRFFYPPSQKTTALRPWINARGGPSEARRAKEGASADFAEEMKDTTGISPWRLHNQHQDLRSGPPFFGPETSPHFSPEREARAGRCPDIQGAREIKRAGVLYSRSSPLSEPSAVDSGLPHIALAKWGRYTHAAVGW